MTAHKAYMSREAEASLINIIYEKQDFTSGSYYEIFWYHWPRDGVFPWEDCEPIVFAYNYKHELCFVLVRRGWRAIILNPGEASWPPEILFKGGFHHQFVRMTTDEFGDFEPSSLIALRTLNVDSHNVTLVNSGVNSHIPSWNIDGVGENIYDKIRATVYESCEP
ncbi:MAG: hypothetical protein ACYC7D_13615 [Nitrososphaerales archaeon]